MTNGELFSSTFDLIYFCLCRWTFWVCTDLDFGGWSWRSHVGSYLCCLFQCSAPFNTHTHSSVYQITPAHPHVQTAVIIGVFKDDDADNRSFRFLAIFLFIFHASVLSEPRRSRKARRGKRKREKSLRQNVSRVGAHVHARNHEPQDVTSFLTHTHTRGGVRERRIPVGPVSWSYLTFFLSRWYTVICYFSFSF